MKAYENVAPADLPSHLRHLEAERARALRQNDADLMKPLLSRGMVFVDEDGSVHTRAEYLAALASGKLVYGADVRFELQHSYLQDPVFIAVGLITGEMRVQGRTRVRRVRYAATWLRRTNGWENQVVQLTAIGPGVDVEIDLGGETVIDVD